MQEMPERIGGIKVKKIASGKEWVDGWHLGIDITLDGGYKKLFIAEIFIGHTGYFISFVWR